MLDNNDCTAEDIFILIPSLPKEDSMSPIQFLENLLVEARVPVHVNRSSNSGSDAVVRGKVVVSTIHASKGLERKHVFLFDFNKGQYSRSNRFLVDPNVCPNLINVAVTRAKVSLHLMGEEFLGTHFPFLNMDNLRRLHGDPHCLEIIKVSKRDGGGMAEPFIFV